jgi:hypothetical protein
MHININCGLSDTEVKELAVKPIGLLSLSSVVTIVTPVGNVPSALRKSCMKSLFVIFISIWHFLDSFQ